MHRCPPDIMQIDFINHTLMNKVLHFFTVGVLS